MSYNLSMIADWVKLNIDELHALHEGALDIKNQHGKLSDGA